MTDCAECGSSDYVEQHHTSYDPENTVPLCRSCHQQVHADESHRLHPDDSGRTTTIQITMRQKEKLDNIKISGSLSYADVISNLISEHESSGASETLSDGEKEEVREIVLEEIKDKVRFRALE